MLQFLNDAKDFFQIVAKTIRYNEKSESLAEEKEDFVEVPEEELPYGPAFVKLDESTIDSNVYSATLTSEHFDEEVTFLCSWAEWEEHGTSLPALVANEINLHTYLEGAVALDPEVVEEWATEFGEDYMPTMLWILHHKYTSYYNIVRYIKDVETIEKRQITCKFKDLPDQKVAFN